MTAGPRRAAASAALGLLAPLATAAAQTATPNLFLAIPPRSHVLVEMDLSWSQPRAFVSYDRDVERFPGSVGFGLGVLRVSWAPFSRVALGLEAPYRVFRYRPDGFTETTSRSGSPGAGVFVDWAPSREGAPLVWNARAEAFFSNSAAGLPLGTAEGINRYSLTGQVTTPATGGLVPGVRADFDCRFEYAPTPLLVDTFLDMLFLLRAGPRLARLDSAELELLAVVGYRNANAAREEANFFHDLHANNLVVGALLDLASPRSPRGLSRSVGLSVTRQIGLSNALDGWRATLTLRTGL